jgi:hypothetical protein
MSDTASARHPSGAAKDRQEAAAPMPALLTSSQVSDYLDVPASTLANWRYQGSAARSVDGGCD